MGEWLWDWTKVFIGGDILTGKKIIGMKNSIWSLGLKNYHVLMVLRQSAKFPTKRRSHLSISDSMFPIKLSCCVVGPKLQVFISVYLDTVDGRCISDVVYSMGFYVFDHDVTEFWGRRGLLHCQNVHIWDEEGSWLA